MGKGCDIWQEDETDEKRMNDQKEVETDGRRIRQLTRG
jgi:hypothetical protein